MQSRKPAVPPQAAAVPAVWQTPACTRSTFYAGHPHLTDIGHPVSPSSTFLSSCRIIVFLRGVNNFVLSLSRTVSLSGESSMGDWDRLMIASLLLLPAFSLPDSIQGSSSLPDSIQGSSNPELSVAPPRARRAVPLYVSGHYYNPVHHKLVEPYYRPQDQSNGIADRSESDLYTSYSAGMWVVGGLFTLVSVIAPGVVSAFSSVEPGKVPPK